MDWIELLWFGAAVVGATTSGVNLLDALLDCRAARGHPYELEIARMQLRGEALRLLTLLAFAVAGALALLTEPGGWPRLAIVGALLLGHGLLVLNSMADRADRHRLLHGRGTGPDDPAGR